MVLRPASAATRGFTMVLFTQPSKLLLFTQLLKLLSALLVVAFSAGVFLAGDI